MKTLDNSSLTSIEQSQAPDQATVASEKAWEELSAKLDAERMVGKEAITGSLPHWTERPPVTQDNVSPQLDNF